MQSSGYQQMPQAPVMQVEQPLPQAQDKPKVPAKSKPGGDVGAFIQQCISLCAYLKELETQSHLIHLNYEGSNFLGVHAFLKDQYEAHLEQFDTLGEFVRSMDYLMLAPLLALVVDGLPVAQADVKEERRGPRVDAPQNAIDGFLRAIDHR